MSNKLPEKPDADVMIIGAGPVGLLLANLLGSRGRNARNSAPCHL